MKTPAEMYNTLKRLEKNIINLEKKSNNHYKQYVKERVGNRNNTSLNNNTFTKNRYNYFVKKAEQLRNDQFWNWTYLS